MIVEAIQHLLIPAPKYVKALGYLQETQKTNLEHVLTMSRYALEDFMVLVISNDPAKDNGNWW